MRASTVQIVVRRGAVGPAACLIRLLGIPSIALVRGPIRTVAQCHGQAPTARAFAVSPGQGRGSGRIIGPRGRRRLPSLAADRGAGRPPRDSGGPRRGIAAERAWPRCSLRWRDREARADGEGIRVGDQPRFAS